ncbi:hypothetical protein [Streptomyces sp. NPDC001536]|uniref:hypothetical protein n=1 Tax=Streptomyces sp. NPDC001536 TaxID=3364583 RepID=UPI0036D04F35
MASELGEFRDALQSAMDESPETAQRVMGVLSRFFSNVQWQWSSTRGSVGMLSILRHEQPEAFAELQALASKPSAAPGPRSVAAGRDIGIAVSGDRNTLATGDSVTHVAGDHLDFRDATFHDQVIGVQHVRNTYETRPGVPQPVVDDWPTAKDVEPLAHGVRPTRRGQGLPPLPPYVRRDADGAVRAALEQAGADGGLVVVLGEPFGGKTRTALEAAAEVLPDARVFAPARGEDLRALPAVLRGRLDPVVLWLDDLDTHLGDGLEPRLLAQLTGQGVVVLATLREDAYDECRNTPRGRVLDLAHMVELPREWSEAERERAGRAGDARLTEAARRSGAEGVAAYLSVGPLLWEEWRRARRADRHPRGHALVRAAIDLARCGLQGPVSQDLLVKVHEADDDDVGAGVERESVDEALVWAAGKRHGALRMLRRSGMRMWEAAPYLVETAAQDAGFPAVDASVWRCALEAARGDAAYDFEVVARRAGEAFRSAADAGDSQAMFELGRLARVWGGRSRPRSGSGGPPRPGRRRPRGDWGGCSWSGARRRTPNPSWRRPPRRGTPGRRP